MEGDYGLQEGEFQGPHPHPYLHDPLLYITNLPTFVTDEILAVAFMYCGPFRPKIQRDTSVPMLSGTIEFKFLEKGMSYAEWEHVAGLAAKAFLFS